MIALLAGSILVVDDDPNLVRWPQGSSGAGLLGARCCSPPWLCGAEKALPFIATEDLADDE